MKLLKLRLSSAGLLMAALLSGSANAAVINGPTVDGLATFTDTNTGLDWLKLNDFFNVSGTQMIAAATAAGFTVATSANVQVLTNTLPLDGTFATWNSYASVMGSAPNRQLIWGAYAPDPSANLGWAFSYSNTGWYFVDNAYPANSVANGGGPYADENLWAFKTGVSGVPELSTWAMMLIGFGGLGFAGYRRTKSQRAAIAA